MNGGSLLVPYGMQSHIRISSQGVGPGGNFEKYLFYTYFAYLLFLKEQHSIKLGLLDGIVMFERVRD